MRCGAAIIESLQAHGVDHVFGIPGTHNLDFYDHLPASSIRHVTPRHEQGAGYAADAYARASGRPAVCLTTTGPGLLNAITAAGTAHHDSVPMLILSPGMPTDVEGRDIGFLHEVKSQTGAMGSVTRSVRADDSESALIAIRDAFDSFERERPRPVHVEVPLDVLDGDAPSEIPVMVPREPEPIDLELIAVVAAKLAAASRPCLLLGGGSVGASVQVKELCERLGIPVLTTVAGKGTLSERHPLSLGSSLRLSSAKELLIRADVVLAVGTELSESELWQPEIELEGELIRIDIDPQQLNKNVAAEIPVLADSATSLDQLLAALPDEVQADKPRWPAGEIEEARARIEAEAHIDGSPFAALHHAIEATTGDEGILVGDSAQVVYYGTVHQMVATAPRRLLYPVGFATLGYTIPGAVGAKLARPEAPVVGIAGDGGIMFTLAELAAAADLGIPLPIIVYNNHGYREIKREMQERGAEPLAVDLDPPDFVDVATAMGARGVRLESAESCQSALSEALEADRPTIIEITEEAGR